MSATCPKLLVALVILLGLLPANLAFAEIEASGVAGFRWFNPKSELGRYLDDPPETALRPMATFGMRLGWLPSARWAIEGELTVTPTGTQDDNASVVILSTRTQVVFNLLTGRVRPLVAVGGGFSFASTANPVWLETDSDAEGHVGLGVRVDLGPDWGLRADARAIAGPGQDKKPTLSSDCVISIYGRFPWASPPAPSTDKDEDGITDDLDKCPDVAGAVTLSGCPGDEKSDDDVDAEEAENKGKPAAPTTPKPAPPAEEKKP